MEAVSPGSGRSSPGSPARRAERGSLVFRLFTRRSPHGGGWTSARELPGGLLVSVRAATREDGAEAVLKVGAWHLTHHEIAALRVWGGRGAPALLEADEELRALLLERIQPGAHPDRADAGAVAAVLREIHVTPPSGLPSLAETVVERIDNALRDERTSRQKADWARTKAAELERDAPPAVLLHGDFDDRNLLVCGRRGLCAVDPLPIAGDPAYDAAYWVHGNRAPGRRARLDAIAAITGLDRARVRLGRGRRRPRLGNRGGAGRAAPPHGFLLSSLAEPLVDHGQVGLDPLLGRLVRLHVVARDPLGDEVLIVVRPA